MADSKTADFFSRPRYYNSPFYKQAAQRAPPPKKHGPASRKEDLRLRPPH
jgi:hypothetical protein